jgi:hypothetical protein
MAAMFTPPETQEDKTFKSKIGSAQCVEPILLDAAPQFAVPRRFVKTDFVIKILNPL